MYCRHADFPAAMNVQSHTHTQLNNTGSLTNLDFRAMADGDDGEERPGLGAAEVAGGVFGGASAVALAPSAVASVGFTSTGILAGSPAATLMSWYGGSVPAYSLCAGLQSLGAVGLGHRPLRGWRCWGRSASEGAPSGRAPCGR